MFDSVWLSWKCSVCGYSASRMEFQTKDLQNALDDYKIGDSVKLPFHGIRATEYTFEIHGDNVHECKDGWNWFWIEGEAMVMKNILTYVVIKTVEKTPLILSSKEGTYLKFINADRDMTCWYDTRKKIGGWSSFGKIVE